MRNKNKLKNMKVKKNYINDKMTKAESKTKKKVKERIKIGKVVKIGFQKVVVDNEKWKIKLFKKYKYNKAMTIIRQKLR